MIPVVNFIFWFVVYAVAAYLLIRIFRIDVRSRALTSGGTGLVTTILDAATTQSVRGPVTGLSLFPQYVPSSGQTAPLPPYLAIPLIFVVAFCVVYVISKRINVDV